MIGLGSNRLTVCRRGGMSVTQAGRGGMEWLAGVRMPSWASPYSAQATAALQAQFPTQWPTIRDYGIAHPEIVGYMNAYAPEDAKIAYSLVAGLGIRWVANGGTAYFTTRHAITVADVEIGCNYMQVANVNSSHIWGSTQSGTSNYKLNPFGSNGSYTLWSKGSSVGLSFNTPIGSWVNFVVKATNSRIELNANGTITSKNHTSDLVGGIPFDIFQCHGVERNYSIPNGKVTEWYFKESGTLIERYVPYLKDGQAELLDLVSGQLAIRTGTASISETSPS